MGLLLRARLRLAAVALLVTALPLLPARVEAAETAVECTGVVAMGSTARCTITFTAPSVPTRIALRHGHFHDVAARGTVGLEWYWPDGRFWFHNCMPAGLSFGGTPVLGDFDNSVQCGSVRSGTIADPDSFVPPPGTHRLYVTAGAELCASTTVGVCTFHGRLVLQTL